MSQLGSLVRATLLATWAALGSVGCGYAGDQQAGTGDNDGVGGCRQPQTQCGEYCYDLASDEGHCGDCETACAADQLCIQGECGCGADREQCDDGCADLTTDTENCGACGTSCQDDAACVGGACRICQTACDGHCANLQNDPENCGGCGQVCAVEERCEAGHCACPNGRELCGISCVDRDSAPEHCGGCDLACAADEVCAKGECRIECPPHLAACNRACVDFASDELHCGSCTTRCQPEEQCVEGVCDCPGSKQPCGAECVDPSSDARHCGGCDERCGPGEVCADSACVLSCPPGSTPCNESCFELSSDPKHCGACGNECELEQGCIEGECKCAAGKTLCDHECVSTGSSPFACGACGVACTAGEVCAVGACQVSCPGGQTSCSGACVSLDTDAEHCGTCQTTCLPEQRCTLGECGCVEGKTECGAQCVSLDSDPSNCGACGVSCGAGKVCSAGSCQLSCPPGLANCGGACVDLAKDEEHCGSCHGVCGESERCLNGECDCPGAQLACDGQCVDTTSDPRHCGGCGAVCGEGRACSQGKCRVSCLPEQTECHGACVDTSIDGAHCGACDAACPPEQRCVSSKCGCPGKTDCSGSCVDLTSDPTNCGKCGASCGAGEVCSGGGCQTSCPLNQTSCQGACVDLTKDEEHCGGCGAACALEQLCTAQKCECPNGRELCGDQCLDTLTDVRHCGDCSTRCGPDERCSEGTCEPTTSDEPRCPSVLTVPLNAQDPFPLTSTRPACSLTGGVGSMTFQLPSCGDGSYSACVFSSGVNLNAFDADNQAGGVIEVEFCSTGRISGELNLWYGTFPTRKKLELLAAGEVLDGACRTVRRAPEQAVCHWTARGEWAGDCGGPDGPGFDKSCRACGSSCNQGCGLSFSSARLTLVAERCTEPQAVPATVELKAVRFLPKDCTCTNDSQCNETPGRTECAEALFSSRVCPPRAALCGVCVPKSTNCASCPPGQACRNGVCEGTCPAGLTLCGDECVDLNNDPEHCGNCKTVCESPHGVPACVSGECRLVACTPGFGDADHDESNGCECTITGSEQDPDPCDDKDNDCDGITDFEFEPNPQSSCRCFERPINIDRHEPDAEGSSFPRCAATSCELLPGGGMEMAYCFSACDVASPPHARCLFAGPVNLQDFDVNFGHDGVLEVVFEVVSSSLRGKLLLNYGTHPRRKYVQLVGREETLSPGLYRKYYQPGQIRFFSESPLCPETCGPCAELPSDPLFRFDAVDMTLVAEACAGPVDARVRLLDVNVVSDGCGCVSDQDCEAKKAERPHCLAPSSGAGVCGWNARLPGVCGAEIGCASDVPLGTPCVIDVGQTTCSGTWQCRAGQLSCEVQTCP